MDIITKMAILGRKYERQRVPRNGSTRFTLGDVLEMFDHNLILELTPNPRGSRGQTVRPDQARKLKVSLLDTGISAIHSNEDDWYEVFRTAPDGDLSKVRIVAHARDDMALGSIEMLLGRRDYAHYFEEDPIFEHIGRQDSADQRPPHV